MRRGAVEKVLRGPQVQRVVDTVTDDVAAACGKGYKASTMQGKSRYRGIVFPGTGRAVRDARKNNTMLNVASARGMKPGQYDE